MNEGAQDGNGNGSGDWAGTGTGTGVGTRRRTPDGNGDGNGDISEDSSGDGNGDDDNGNGNENRIGEGGREVKKRKKPQNTFRRRAGNGGDTGGKRKKCRKERVGSVTANPDNLESNKEAGGGAQGTQGSSKNCTSRESVSSQSRLIRGFRNKYRLLPMSLSEYIAYTPLVIEAARQKYAQTAQFRYLGGLVNEDDELTQEINHRSRAAWPYIRRFSRKLFERPRAPWRHKV